eukprot:SAG11_NODE_23357_length_390_cov_0.707904_1_plen_44_part_01
MMCAAFSLAVLGAVATLLRVAAAPLRCLAELQATFKVPTRLPAI